jgi:hypothetical protein
MSGGVRRGVTIADVDLRTHDRRDVLPVQLSLLQELNHFIHCGVLGSRGERRRGGGRGPS